jgi:hypothetical protein
MIDFNDYEIEELETKKLIFGKIKPLYDYYNLYYGSITYTEYNSTNYNKDYNNYNKIIKISEDNSTDNISTNLGKE